MSGTAVDDTLVADLARSVVEQTAPEELPLFHPTTEAFFENPDAIGRRGGRDEMLGFGVEAAVVLVTPVALSVARDVLRFVTDQVRSRLATEGEGAVQGALDRIFRREAKPGSESAPAAARPDLSDEELARVRAMAFEKAQQLRLPPEKAGLLADAIVGGLATG